MWKIEQLTLLWIFRTKRKYRKADRVLYIEKGENIIFQGTLPGSPYIFKPHFTAQKPQSFNYEVNIEHSSYRFNKSPAFRGDELTKLRIQTVNKIVSQLKGVHPVSVLCICPTLAQSRLDFGTKRHRT